MWVASGAVYMYAGDRVRRAWLSMSAVLLLLLLLLLLLSSVILIKDPKERQRRDR